MLTAFIVGQIVLDVVLLGLAIVVARSWPRLRPGASPPEWYQEFLRLAEDLLAVTEPVLAALESPAAERPGAAPSTPASVAPEPPGARYRAAFSLLRAGGPREDVIQSGRLLPRELRLIENLLAAESRLSSPGK
jgi:hypothetical protein